MRLVVAPDVVEHRQDDREDDPLLDPDVTTTDAGHGGDPELLGPQPADLAQAEDVDQLQADQEDDRRQDRLGQVLERLGQEQQDDGDR